MDTRQAHPDTLRARYLPLQQKGSEYKQTYRHSSLSLSLFPLFFAHTYRGGVSGVPFATKSTAAQPETTDRKWTRRVWLCPATHPTA